MISEVLIGIAVAGFFTFVLIVGVFYFTKWLNEQSKPKPTEQKPADYPMVDAVNVFWDLQGNSVSASIFVDAKWITVATVNLKVRDKALKEGRLYHTTTLPIDTIKRMPRPVTFD